MCVCVYVLCMLVPGDARRGLQIPWTGVLCSCEPQPMGTKNPHFIIIIFIIEQYIILFRKYFLSLSVISVLE